MVACSARNVSMLKLKQINVCSCGTCVCGLAMEVLTKSSIQARISINTSNTTGGFIGVDEIMINLKYESFLIQNLQVWCVLQSRSVFPYHNVSKNTSKQYIHQRGNK
ncbi:hypothetical protein AMECASPLE_025892 [Ameca splendens]|uniref:Uncharacterized protein n=1 Tax=Ameca splendens TaxID=208324 RepID=A0ABV0ZDP5_9TELE